MNKMGEEREEVRRRTQINIFGLGESEFKAIAEKYGLVIEESKGSVWMSLKVPEANTEITWYK